ncbi:MAG TPA: molybdate ABC transporter substrate-binding protein [Burkholderiaceae bacterium]|nr:molybdate ABC transporter substrate-binding protein [Burkholderiaceae bacterium]
MRQLSIFLLLSLAASSAVADNLRVAVAANFTEPMRKISALFEQASGHKLELIFGSTGKFYAQVSNGAPFDVLLAADEETPARLAAEGNAVSESRFTYATGKLALWSPTAGYVDDQGHILKSGSFRHISLANPDLAPYGAAAVSVLKNLGVYESLRPKIVLGENITQAHQFVATGAAELGFVALSQVMKEGKVEGSVWIVPSALHAPIRQDAIVLDKGRGKAAATELLAYLKSDAARRIIASYGYSF